MKPIALTKARQAVGLVLIVVLPLLLLVLPGCTTNEYHNNGYHDSYHNGYDHNNQSSVIVKVN